MSCPSTVRTVRENGGWRLTAGSELTLLLFASNMPAQD